MPQSSPSTLPIVFFDDPDSDAACETLGRLLRDLPQSTFVLGLIVKVTRSDVGEERIVNWEFAAPETLKSLALVLPPQKTNEAHPATPSEE